MHTVPQALWRGLEQHGIRPEAVLRQARLPATLRLASHTPIRIEQYFALWNAITALSNTPAIGLELVAKADASAYPPSTFASFFAHDYRDALHRTVRFKRLCSPEQLMIEITGNECRICVDWPHASAPVPPVLIDITFATLLELGRRGTAQHLIPIRVEFARAGPAPATHTQFFGCPIRCNAPKDLLVLKSSDLDRPFPGRNDELLQILTPALASALRELDASDSIDEQIQALIKRRLPSGRPELKDIAHELGLSERTLQRRITAAGTTFRELILRSRQTLGRELLTTPNASIDEIAYLLGFEDTTSFHRAFRDWEGTTPNRWRAQHAATPSAQT